MKLVDYRVEFSKWWVTEFKTIKFPSQGTVFDYYIDPETKKFEPWSKMVPEFEMDPDTPLQVQHWFLDSSLCGQVSDGVTQAPSAGRVPPTLFCKSFLLHPRKSD